MNNISVNGMPRHVLDVRPVVIPVSPSDDSSEMLSDDSFSGESAEPREEDQGEAGENLRPRRNRRPPVWMADYVSE